MSQEEIFEIIKVSHIPLSADKIRIRLLNKGITIRETNFYQNIKKLEKDGNIHFKDIKVQDTDFIERVWWYNPKLKPPLNNFQFLKRLAKQAGLGKHTKGNTERILLLKRQFDALNDTLKNVRIALKNWLEGANRYKSNPEISPLISEANNILERIK